ncbi:hypothetical protein ACEYW6_35540 [Nostoc sp. UIC 10607]
MSIEKAIDQDLTLTSDNTALIDHMTRKQQNLICIELAKVPRRWQKN